MRKINTPEYVWLCYVPFAKDGALGYPDPVPPYVQEEAFGVQLPREHTTMMPYRVFRVEGRQNLRSRVGLHYAERGSK